MSEHLSLVVTVAIIAGLVQGLVALRWYEPDVEDAPETPMLEAAFFFIIFSILFAIIGWVLGRIALAAPPYSAYALLVLTLIGLVVAISGASGKLGPDKDEVVRYLGAVFFATIAAFPVLFLLA